MKPSRMLFVGMVGATILFASCSTGKKLEAANSEIAALKASSAALEQENTTLKSEREQIRQVATEAATAFEAYKAACDAAKAKLAIGKAVLDENVRKLKAVDEKVEAALADFSGKGVEVEYKGGQVYISMGTSLLYKSGSAVLSEAGIAALNTVAGAVNNYPDLQLIVVGNTDDKQFKKGSDNWSLSTERANSVIRSLIAAKVDPARLTAAGKGKYNPVADNSTEAGRTSNRRTEIILSPDIDKLWESAGE